MSTPTSRRLKEQSNHRSASCPATPCDYTTQSPKTSPNDSQARWSRKLGGGIIPLEETFGRTSSLEEETFGTVSAWRTYEQQQQKSFVTPERTGSRLQRSPSEPCWCSDHSPLSPPSMLKRLGQQNLDLEQQVAQLKLQLGHAAEELFPIPSDEVPEQISDCCIQAAVPDNWIKHSDPENNSPHTFSYAMHAAPATIKESTRTKIVDESQLLTTVQDCHKVHADPADTLHMLRAQLEIKKLQKEVKDHKGQMRQAADEHKAQRAEVQQQMLQLQSRVSTEQVECTLVKAKLERVEAENKLTQAELAEHQGILASTETEHADALMAMDTEIGTLQAMCEETAQLQRSPSEPCWCRGHAELKPVFEKNDCHSDDLRAALEKMKTALQDKDHEFEKLTLRLQLKKNGGESESAHGNAELAKHQANCAAMKTEHAEALIAKDKEIGALKAMCEETDRGHAELKAVSEKNECHSDELKAALKKLQAALVDKDCEFEKLKSENDEVKAAVQRKDSELAQAKAAAELPNTAATSEINQIKASFERQVSEEKEREMTELKAALEVKKQELGNLRAAFTNKEQLLKRIGSFGEKDRQILELREALMDVGFWTDGEEDTTVAEELSRWFAAQNDSRHDE